MSLSVTALTKQYGGSTALNRLSVTFEPNVIYGLFGRNGAGKSTLLGCIGNRLIPDTGRIVLDGEPLAECERLMARVYLANERLPWWDGVTLSAMLADCAYMDGRFDLGLARELV
ncbi:MAG: ATP-binding cassette domain-containing protein, partial [Bifidobacterium sp.]|nr:ATP-binding cassette domain-containing protein [Bifidobacterium sp.]